MFRGQNRNIFELIEDSPGNENAEARKQIKKLIQKKKRKLKEKLGENMNRTQRHHEQASTFEEDISDDDLSQMTDSSIIKILRLGPRNARDRPVKAVVNFPSFNHSAFPPLSPTAIIARNSDLWSNDQKGGEEKKHPFGKILMD